MERLKELASHYLFPIILLILGGWLVIYKFGNEQSELFLLAGVAVLLVGLITLLYSAGLINRILQTILLVLLIPSGIALAYLNYYSIESKLEEKQKAEEMRSITIQGLKDIRKVQVAFEERYGKYASTHDSLVHFLKMDSIQFVRTVGGENVPDTLSERQALEKGILERDTLFTPVLDSLFAEDQERKVREGKRAYRFFADSLPYKRGTGKKFILDAGEIEQGGVTRSVFVAKDPAPFTEEEDTLQVGSMREPKKSGNWGDQ